MNDYVYQQMKRQIKNWKQNLKKELLVKLAKRPKIPWNKITCTIENRINTYNFLFRWEIW